MVNVLMAPAGLLLPIPRPDATRIVLALAGLRPGEPGTPGRFHDEMTTNGWKLLFLRQRYQATAQVRELASDPDWYDRPPDAFDVFVRALLFFPREAAGILENLHDRLEVLPRLFRQPWPCPPAGTSTRRCGWSRSRPW